MASKKAQADAAFRRNEVQRALRVVLDAALLHRARCGSIEAGELASAMQLVESEFLIVGVAVKSSELPGQLSISGDVVAGCTGAEKVADVPAYCPGCERRQTLDLGWTPVIDSQLGKTVERIQCGNCGAYVIVGIEAFEQLRAALRAKFGASDLKPAKLDRGKRTRGAG